MSYNDPRQYASRSDGYDPNDDDDWAPHGRNRTGERVAAPVTGAAAAHSLVTPGVDNYGEGASGGMAGIASLVAERNARESGIQATRPMTTQSRNRVPDMDVPQQTYAAPPHAQPYPRADPFATESNSYSSLNSSSTVGPSANSDRGSSHHAHPVAYPTYRDDPYGGLSRTSQRELGVVDPNAIADDGDGDDFGGPAARPTRRSWLSQHSTSTPAAGAAGAVAAVAVATGAATAAAASSTRAAGDVGGAYGPVATNYAGAGPPVPPAEKSEWLKDGPNKKTKMIRWAIIIVVLLGIAAIVVGTLYGTGVFGGKGDDNNDSGGGGGGGQSAGDDMRSNGDLDINSAEIQALLSNQNLHKVFPGIDYTPINSQYPDCIRNPPSQNNVTRDMAVLSQLTNQVRLYGTDCNQTAMAVHAIRQLQMEDTMKIWLGVWQDNNETTNARQLAQMWDTLDTYGQDPFAGLIVANEILFREQMTAAELGSLIGDVRQNLTDRNMHIEVSTSDLGDDWNSSVNQTSAAIMANIHPFFAGEPATNAASWTYTFWSGVDGQWWRADNNKNIIAETGWPTQGGTSCGSATVTNCGDSGSVAGVDGLNQFMDDWVCQALSNRTRYFWFTAFDEPWKIQFNEPGREWEDHWGILDVNRNLKDGVKIPDCGGVTVEDAGW